MYTVFVALFAVMVVVSARPAADEPCVSPKQWEADESLEVDALNMSVIYRASYDAINKQVRALVQYDPEEHEYIILYNKRRLYSIVRKTGECTVSEYDTPFTPAEIPKNATFVADGFFGLKNTGLPYEVYYGKIQVEENKGYYLVCVTKKECALMFTKSVLKGITSRLSLFNIELGIKDPSVFTPPSSCKEGPLPEMFKYHPRY